MKKLILIDAYSQIFRAYYAFIKNPRINSKGQNTSAIVGFCNTLHEVLTKEKPDYVGVAFDPKGPTFRHEAYPEYKAQRDATPEDIHASVPIIKNILKAMNIPVLEVEGYEADDVIGTLAMQASKVVLDNSKDTENENNGYNSEAVSTHPDSKSDAIAKEQRPQTIAIQTSLFDMFDNTDEPKHSNSTIDTTDNTDGKQDNKQKNTHSTENSVTVAQAEKDPSPTPSSTDGILTYMLTPDKDYGQLVRENVKMYRPRHMGGYDVMGPEEVCAKYGISSTEQVVDLLGLMGDSADNIPGCPGVGEKTAVKLISEFGSIENLIESTDQLKGALKKKVEDNKEKIVFSKFLATIKTDVPVTLNLNELTTTPPDEQQLRQIFAELEFKTLADKFLKKGNQQLKSVESNIKNSHEITTNGSLFEETTQLESIKTRKHKYVFVDNKEDRLSLCETLLRQEKVCFDTETTSTVAMEAELVGMSFSFEEGEAYYVPVPSERDKAMEVVNDFSRFFSSDIMKIGQNIKYDLEVLANYDVIVNGQLFDTMIAHYLLQPEQRHGMDYLAEVYLKYETIHIEELIGPKGRMQANMRDIPPRDVCDYAAEDADITFCLYNVLCPKLEENNLTKLFNEVEMPLVKVLMSMEREGVRLDTSSLQETSCILSDRLDEIEKHVYELAGEVFNISSPRQVGDILFGKLKVMDKPKKTKTGQFVTNEEVLQKLAGKHEIVSEILAYRGLKKLLGTYVDALPLLVNKKTGRIHTSYNQAITATGRLSSSDPNLQNIPIRGEDGKEIRKAFVPEEGCLFFSADYSQIELRVMAHLSQDEAMISAFRNGYDVHAATAAKVYKKDIEEVTRDERTKAKRANFGIIYGITTFGLAERLNIERAEAKQLIDGYFETFPKVEEYMEKSKQMARENGYAETFLHRRRFLPDINSGNATVRGFAERNAINAPIQGSAADIIKMAMVNIHKRFIDENIRSKMILQVHDELNFSVFPDEKEKVEKIVLEEMQNAYPLSVPLVADCGWGNNWLEAH